MKREFFVNKRLLIPQLILNRLYYQKNFEFTRRILTLIKYLFMLFRGIDDLYVTHGTC